MSQSKYFGKSFVAILMQGEGPGGHFLEIGERPGEENYVPGPGKDTDEAFVGLVDTLRVTRKLLKLSVRKLGIKITDPNELKREVDAAARKIGESPEHVRVIVEQVFSELFQEMIAKPQPKKK